jgi:hypothetical protein
MTINDEEMDRIFTQFCEERSVPAPRPLTAWIAAHPELSAEFVKWAAEVPALQVAEARAVDPEFERKSLAIGRATMERVGLRAIGDGVLTSLNDAARRQGVSPRDLAQALGIGMSLFAKLNRRLVRAATVPARLMDRLSQELLVSAEEVRAYLAQAPMLAPGAEYKAERPPESTDAQDFSEAVQASPDMSPEQKAEWLS